VLTLKKNIRIRQILKHLQWFGNFGLTFVVVCQLPITNAKEKIWSSPMVWHFGLGNYLVEIARLRGCNGRSRVSVQTRAIFREGCSRLDRRISIAFREGRRSRLDLRL
jgi:hypothetical protein